MAISAFKIQNERSSDIVTNNQNNTIVQTRPLRSVQAYAKLEFNAFSFYVQTLQVIIGRKASRSDQVDVHIGSTKAISRQHAKLFYDFTSQHFKIFVMGKNGAFVDEQFVECGKTIPLYDKTKIQIDKVFFTFLLPNATEKENTENERNTNTDQVKIEEFGFPEDNSGSSDNVLTKSSCTTCPDIELDQEFTKTHELGISSESVNIMDNKVPKFDNVNINSHNEPVFSHDKSCNVLTKEHIKPNLSYASLIAQAILSSPNKKMTLSDIYEWISQTYKYYKYAQNGWQNSIRHSLSLNKVFKKVFRKDDEPGKGSFWTIDFEYQNQLKSGIYKRNRKNISLSPQHSISESPTMIDDISLKPLTDSVPIVIMQDGQLSLNPEYFNSINNNSDSSKVQIVQAIVLLQKYVITQLGPHAKNPQNAAAIANALIVALDQQLQKHKCHKDFIPTTFKNLTSLSSITEKKTVSSELSIKNEKSISKSLTPLTFLTQSQNTDASGITPNLSTSQSYSMSDELVSKQLYPVQIPPPPPYYSKSQTSSLTNHVSSDLIEKKEHIQALSSKSHSTDSSLSCKQRCKRPYEDDEKTVCFIGEAKALLENDSKNRNN
ncbi:hypothetical protein PMAC_002151 [Pneumocystis sp. 'macacae']|nr:hypothetical protein PMAC_002151 [Pneumocystis sp. 'macacae']